MNATDQGSHQCHQCAHWKLTGGIVGAPRWSCHAMEEESGSVRIIAAIQALLPLAADKGNCPIFDEMVARPDSYISADLEPHPLAVDKAQTSQDIPGK